MKKIVFLLGIIITTGVGYASTSQAATFTVDPGSAGSLCSGNYPGRACSPATQTNFNIQEAGRYRVSVRVERGNNIALYECQGKESFFMIINGQRTPVVRDPDSCEWSGTIRTQSVGGEYALRQGNNVIQLFHAHFGEPNIGIESLRVLSIRFASVAVPVNGVCGPSNGQTFDTRPTSGLCSAGTSSNFAGSGPWTWICLGSNGGSNASCRANITSPPTCGPSNGQTFDTRPTSGLCELGAPSTVSGAGPWTWTCTRGNRSVSCRANITPAPICGPSHGGTFSDVPTEGLCSVGTTSRVSGNGPWTWRCINGARFVDCNANYSESAIQIIKEATDGSDSQEVAYSGDAAFRITVTNVGEEILQDIVIRDELADNCSRSAAQTQDLYSGNLFDADESFSYECVDPNIEENYTNIARVRASATTSQITVNDRDASDVVIRSENAFCGSAHGQTFSSIPTSGLCASGTPSNVSGNGPWTWTCDGAHGGESASCRANIVTQEEPEEPEEEDDDGAIGNFVWHDRNKNCVQDSGEEGISGLKLKLYNGNDIETDWTNSRGRYKFKDLDPGTYRVVVAQETIPAGCYQVCDPDGTKMDGKTKVKIDGDEYHRKADFGYYCSASKPIATTSPNTGAGSVATASFLVAMLSAGIIYRRNMKN